MSLLRRIRGSLFDAVCPGPATGRSGKLRAQILELEARKRDAPIERLLRLEVSSPAPSAWVGLGTLAYEVVRHFRPRRIVELGSFGGFSTCAMGLALRDAGQGGTIYAVDTWEGDGDTKHYGEEVLATFMTNRRELGLEQIIEPVRMTFEQASRVVEPGIDLLHIDGWHKFSAVSADFRAFRRHLNPGAIVMFHDVFTIFRGMRLFWKLTAARYPSHLVPYGHGLGIIQVGESPANKNGR